MSMSTKRIGAIGCLVFACVALASVGCNKSSDKPVPAIAPGTQFSGEEHVHGEWWCGEHGVPEEICAQCKTELAADFKAKGDWCKEHDRPDSQCFICHPEKEAEFAAQFEAKYGKKPPKPTAESGEHDHDAKS